MSAVKTDIPMPSIKYPAKQLLQVLGTLFQGHVLALNEKHS